MEPKIIQYINQYSYWAILVGVMFEGDLTLLVSGMLAHERLLGFGYSTALASALAGAMIGDTFAFLMGRQVRDSISRWKLYVKFYPRFEWLEQRFGASSIVIVKYIYGLRFASSVFWGVSRMGALRFLFLTLLSCGIWVGMMTGVGYLFGSAISQLFDRLGRISLALAIAVVVALLMFVLHHQWVSPTLQKEAEKAGLTQELSVLEAPPGDDEGFGETT